MSDLIKPAFVTTEQALEDLENDEFYATCAACGHEQQVEPDASYPCPECGEGLLINRNGWYFGPITDEMTELARAFDVMRNGTTYPILICNGVELNRQGFWDAFEEEEPKEESGFKAETYEEVRAIIDGSDGQRTKEEVTT